MPANRQEQNDFISAWSDVALDVSKATGVAPEVVLGQAAVETGWGKSVAGNNMFGVKGPGQSVMTHEDYGQGLQPVRDSFRAYSNPEDSFRDYGALMGSSRYSHIGPGMTPDQQIASIAQSGYATDRNYGRLLGGVVDMIQANPNFQDRVVNSIAALDPAIPDFTGVPFNENPYDDNSFRVDPMPAGYVDAIGPPDPVMSPGMGYHAGVGEDPYSGIGPDFSAPSFDAWSNTDAQLARAHDTALGMGAYSSDLNPEAIADRLNKELGPQAPQLAAQTQAAAPSWSDYQQMDFSGLSFTSPPQAQPAQPSASSWSDYTPQDFSGLSFTTPEEAGIPAAPGSRPATTSSIGPVGWDDHTGLTIGGFHSPAEALGFGKPSNDFMDAMANPEIAKGYQSGFNLGPIGITGTGHLTVGGFNSPMDMIGSLFGQTPQPQQTVTQPHGFGFGGILGSIGSMFGGGGNGLAGAMVPNGTGGYRPADMMDAMSNPDIANRVRGSGFLGGLGNMFGGWGNPFSGFGSGGLFGGSEGYYGGGNNGPGSSRGDGSYADSAGYSDNDPQGIL